MTSGFNRSALDLVQETDRTSDEAEPLVAGPSDEDKLAKGRASPREILEALGQVSLAQAMEGELLSVRLENGLSSIDLHSTRFGDVALALDDFLASLRSLPNIGRTSLREMTGLVQRLVPRLLAEQGVQPGEIAIVCEAIFGDQHVETDGATENIPRFATLEECIDWLLAQCGTRDRLIVERRFGLLGAASETLEEIGSDLNVTRERVRQIEKRAMKRMRVRMRRVPLAELITSAAPANWLEITGGRGWITDRHADAALRKLGGVFRLALELLETSPRAWLSGMARRGTYGWIGPPADQEFSAALLEELRELLKLPLPRSVFETSQTIGENVEAALRIELGLELEQGYIVQSRPGLRMRRALGLHRLLASALIPLAAERLLPLYHQLQPSDPCSQRDMDIVMKSAPHLFIETFDQVWYAVGACGNPPDVDGAAGPPAVSVPVDSEPADDDWETCAGSLIAALESRGPERLLTLFQNAHEILAPGRSPNSIGPTMVNNPQTFMRLLPGVYCLRHQVPSSGDLLVSPPPYLLDNTQLRLLAYARRAGERRDVFPLWSAEGEFALARWGQHNGAPENFRSLMAVANVADWPVSGSERAHWIELAKRVGRFELADLPRQDAYVLPELDRLLAACIEAAHSGGLNWMAVNRMAGRRLDSHAAAAVLAILLALGALDCDSTEPSAWQMPHRATEQAKELSARMLEELSKTGILSWNQGLGLKLQDDIRTAGVDLQGWPDVRRFAEMMDARNSMTEPSPSTDVDPLEAIMAGSRQTAESRKREELLRWLLEE